MLKIKNIDLTFNPQTINAHTVFENFNLEISKGDFVSIIGSNGSGKTSLLNLICGSIHASAGQILLQNQDISHLPEDKRFVRIGRVYQDPSFGVAPNMSLLENLALADNKNQRWGLRPGIKKESISRYKELLASLGLGLEYKLNDSVGLLSGGQRQALSLLLATMTPIDVLILDEHTAALDPKTADKIMQLTYDMISEKELTALMVTHNLRDALTYGNRLIMLHQGQIIMDKSGQDKANLELEAVLNQFNQTVLI